MKLRDYQQQIVDNQTDEIIIANMSRCAGKTTMLIEKILKERPFSLYWEVHSDKQWGHVMDKISKYDCVKAIYEDENKMTTIRLDDRDIIIFRKKSDNITYRLAIFDNMLPDMTVKAKQYISCVSMTLRLNELPLNMRKARLYQVGLKELMKCNTLADIKTLKELRDDNIHNFIREIDILNEYENIEIDTDYNDLGFCTKRI